MTRTFNRSTGLGMVSLLMLLAGCATEGPATTVVVTGSDGQPREVSTLQTGYAPKDALKRAAGVFQRLDLTRVKPQGYQPPGGGGLFSSEPKDWPITADAFSGVAYARTASNESIEVTANWQGSGQTTVKITTQLSAAQHGHLVDLISADLQRAPVTK